MQENHLFEYAVIRIVPQVERARIGQDDVAFPTRNGFQDFENLNAIDGAGRPGDADDQPLLHGA